MDVFKFILSLTLNSFFFCRLNDAGKLRIFAMDCCTVGSLDDDRGYSESSAGW